MGSDIFHNNGVGVSDQRALHLNTGTHFPPNDYQFPEIIQNKGKSGGGAQPPAAAHPCTKGEEGADTDRMNDVEAEKEKTRLFDLEKEEIQRFLLDKNAEIIVVLEGVDPMTSHNVQSYHSYISDEIKWDHFFVRCCSVVNGKLLSYVSHTCRPICLLAFTSYATHIMNALLACRVYK